jgi:hypothetical protein
VGCEVSGKFDKFWPPSRIPGTHLYHLRDFATDLVSVEPTSRPGASETLRRLSCIRGGLDPKLLAADTDSIWDDGFFVIHDIPASYDSPASPLPMPLSSTSRRSRDCVGRRMGTRSGISLQAGFGIRPSIQSMDIHGFGPQLPLWMDISWISIQIQVDGFWTMDQSRTLITGLTTSS